MKHPKEEKIIKQAMAQNRPLPAFVQEGPTIGFSLGFYYNAFWELDSSRNTLAPIRGPIPWNAIYQYCLLLRLSEEMIEDMIYHVRELDNAYLNYQDKKGK